MKIMIVAVLSAVICVGCEKQASQEKRSENNQQVISFSEDDKLVKWKNGQPLLNLIVLSRYYECHETGSYPAKDQTRRTLARAFEIAINKGYKLKPSCKLHVESRATVPVKIVLDGVSVTLEKADFKPIELEMVQFVSQADVTWNNKDIPSFFLRTK